MYSGWIFPGNLRQGYLTYEQLSNQNLNVSENKNKTKQKLPLFFFFIQPVKHSFPLNCLIFEKDDLSLQTIAGKGIFDQGKE